jgi:hypothetical protein
MPTDVLEAIFTDVSGLISALALGPTIVVRKGPKKEPTVDAATQITVSMRAEGEKKKYIAFGHMATIWPIEITLIAPSKRDYAYNLSTYTSYRQQIEALFGPPFSSPLLPTTPGVYDVRLKPNEFLPRGEIPEGIDRWTIVVEVSTAI